MMRVMRQVLLSVAALVLNFEMASAGCAITGIQSVTPAVLNVGTYTSSSLPPPTTISVTINFLKAGNGIGSCQGSFGLVRSAPPAQMTRVPSFGVALPYAISVAGAPILSFGAVATQLVPLPITGAPNGTATVSATFQFTVTPQAPVAVPASGNYLDQLSLQVFDVQGKQSNLAGQTPLTIAASVVDSCYLSTPNTLNLNFTADVATGIPAGSNQTISFNVNCTGASRVRLSGAALTTAAPGAVSGVFHNFINYRAIANFGGASATLQTNGSVPATVTSPSTSGVSGTNLPVTLNINLIPGMPLIGSTTYNGVLRVTVDPTL